MQPSEAPIALMIADHFTPTTLPHARRQPRPRREHAVVEYKGSQLLTGTDTRKKTAVGKL